MRSFLTTGLGRFYRIVLEDLDAFGTDEKSFKGGKNLQARALPGFAKKFSLADEVIYAELITVSEFTGLVSKLIMRLRKVRFMLSEMFPDSDI